MRNQLTSGAHFAHRIIVQLVTQELLRRRSSSTDGNNNISVDADSMRRLHYAAVAISRTPSAWQKVMKALFAQNSVVERQTIIDNISATHSEESNRAFVGLCSWWDEKSKSNKIDSLMKELEGALKSCKLDHVIEEMTSPRRVPSITQVHRSRLPSVPEATVFFELEMEEPSDGSSSEGSIEHVEIDEDGREMAVEC